MNPDNPYIFWPLVVAGAALGTILIHGLRDQFRRPENRGERAARRTTRRTTRPRDKRGLMRTREEKGRRPKVNRMPMLIGTFGKRQCSSVVEQRFRKPDDRNIK